MGQVLHGRARTTAAVRAAIQRSQESLQTLATRHGIDPKTVAKWRKRSTTTDAVMGPKPISTVLTAEEEAIDVVFHQHTLLPLDDGLYALQATIPRLSRSALHRCFQRHGPSRLPLSKEGQSPPKKKFKDYPIGHFHVDFAEVHTEEGRVYLFVAIDRTSKVAFAELHPRASKMLAAELLRRVLAAWPYKVHKVLTDNGTPFGNMPHQLYAWRHIFDRVCDEHGIEHRFTKPAYPWTNGQVERMNRTLKEATVQRYHYQTTTELNEHLQTFLLAYNYAKRLKRLRGLTPHEFFCAQWQKNPAIFTVTRPSSPWDYTSSSPASPTNRPCPLPHQPRRPGPPTMSLSNTPGARSNGSTFISTRPTMASTCFTNSTRTLPTITTADSIKACATRRRRKVLSPATSPADSCPRCCRACSPRYARLAASS